MDHSRLIDSNTSSTAELEDPLLVRELRVAETIRDLSDVVTIRQMADIHSMSIKGMKDFAAKYGIVFGTSSKRLSSASVKLQKIHTIQVKARSLFHDLAPTLEPGNVPAALKERARRRDLECMNGFVEFLRELSHTHTREQAAKIAGISTTFMRTLAYDHEIDFVGREKELPRANCQKELKKLTSSLFKVKAKPDSTRLIRSFMISDAIDEF